MPLAPPAEVPVPQAAGSTPPDGAQEAVARRVAPHHIPPSGEPATKPLLRHGSIRSSGSGSSGDGEAAAVSAAAAVAPSLFEEAVDIDDFETYYKSGKQG